ncbi:hypothetical protein A3F08_01540 [Candidatus Berkelbacteria bacterium RIFCSPHIGHO2_12_FULL_36_9]|uniref:FAD/NAD(P)-binding domain-containing protein n=1 Tax=Candidatus Berkelbacteria bacterium RIFCSPHIGHO2_12_FULL_36_9 TaxID=1797469 RepID=A0A1F5EK81_9BACT|nr:MAG: hypothetical protein A3F08_01540 [Candidatus Berkelbacteria bacterium RIFCSPHIGHO2_12_FULL_36_9]
MYDLIIIGLGPAGITAGIYAARYKINVLVLGAKPGGYIPEASKIDNYPGFPLIPGLELSNKFNQHLKNFHIPTKQELVEKISKLKNGFLVTTDKSNYEAKAIIVAAGTTRRRLQIPGEKEFMGKGVSFCATCDGFFFKDKTVAVIGGGDSAVTSAIELSHFAKKIYLIFRKESLRALPKLIEELKLNPKIELIPSTNVTKISGSKMAEKITLDKEYNNAKDLAVNGIFIEIGSIPLTDLLKSISAKIDKNGYIEVDKTQQTNVNGVFAAGDSTTGSNGFQQIVTACAEGAIAANSVFKYLRKLK